MHLSTVVTSPAQYAKTFPADRAARYAARTNRAMLHLSSTILPKASRSATKDKDSE
jgi:hypothetical protein